MPAAPLLDLSGVDLSHIVVTRDQIYEALPHRHEFMQLDGLVYLDVPNQMGVGLREVRDDEFWVRGHIPGRPLFPGVLMIETAAQLASYLTHLIRPSDRFLAFGGVDNVKFRVAVSPPATMYFVLKAVDLRARRTVCDVQAFVNKQMAFEGRITGIPM